MRSSSSRIAGIRAAFEKKQLASIPDPVVKRRFASTEKGITSIDKRPIANGYHTAGESEKVQEKESLDLVRVKDELVEERKLRVALEDKCTGLEDEVEALQAQLEDVNVALQNEKQSHLALRHEREKRISPTSDDPRSSQMAELRNQMSDLKRSIATGTRVESQVTDSTFAQQMGVLFHELQNWTINNFRRARADIAIEELLIRVGGLDGETIVAHLRALYSHFDPAVKLPIFQATALCYIMEIFDEPVMFGMSSQPETKKRISEAADSMSAILNAAAFNKWRATTLDAVRTSEVMKQYADASAERIAGRICHTLSALTDAETNHAVAALPVIVKRAITLAHLFKVQRAQYEFAIPDFGAGFDPLLMEDIAADSDAHGTSVLCATSPAVIKLGDEYGNHSHLRNIVVKAKVMCNAP